MGPFLGTIKICDGCDGTFLGKRGRKLLLRKPMERFCGDRNETILYRWDFPWRSNLSDMEPWDCSVGSKLRAANPMRSFFETQVSYLSSHGALIGKLNLYAAQSMGPCLEGAKFLSPRLLGSSTHYLKSSATQVMWFFSSQKRKKSTIPRMRLFFGES